MSGLLVERSTTLIQLQDSGRFGTRQLGVTQGGATDWISMFWANWLLGNPLGAAVIEITLGGLSLIAQQDACLALAGADLGATLDGQPIQPWRSFLVRRDQRLVFRQPIQGARAYLAAPGGFDATPTMGSKSTVCREGLGGLHGSGQALAIGDRLRWSNTSPAPRELEANRIPDLSPAKPLETVLGAQIADFAGQSLFDAFNSPWQVDSRADRMGVRLLGPTLRYQGKALISEGIPLGAIQIPPDGQPIVLLNDRQTIGGYPRLGALTPRSLARLAQCVPGTRLRLSPILQECAQEQHMRVLALWN
ncbi:MULTISPECIES: biotin-dependent carboxyltransferase family protein [Pseudomonas]|uniref:Biotin-dependent carboxyltransferase family protein n=1 Tax=Pseudomonas violetae TaxID=2915813 RepID=A0ABT0ESN1_9PSED|nr:MULTISPECIES: biotin-dependent carboxyltransferase family protein [Pseudomonas]KAF0863996.1 5-oxoprolinase/urea amidolyase family protein [Pseudomonas sp. LD120]MCK1788745.1 biotin-dependent carboxyltransferase family protein [Pseudomonas violetae]